MPIRLVVLSLSALLLLPLAAQAQPPAPPGPAISFEPDTVVASGISPGGRVVWFGMAREISEHAGTIVRREESLQPGPGANEVHRA